MTRTFVGGLLIAVCLTHLLWACAVPAQGEYQYTIRAGDILKITIGSWALNVVPSYRAPALVLIEPEAAKVLNNIQDGMSIAPTWEDYNAQYEMIKTRPVVERAIKTLNLETRMPDLAASATPHGAL